MTQTSPRQPESRTLMGEAASLCRGITKMPLIFASFFLVTILKRNRVLYIHNMWVPICPKQAVPFHIPQPLQLKKKKPKHLSVLIIPSFPARPAFIPSVQFCIFDILVIFFPFVMSWQEAPDTLLKCIFSNQQAAWLESSCQQEITVRPTGRRYGTLR